MVDSEALSSLRHYCDSAYGSYSQRYCLMALKKMQMCCSAFANHMDMIATTHSILEQDASLGLDGRHCEYCKAYVLGMLDGSSLQSVSIKQVY